MHPLALDDYEAANLRAAIEAIGYPYCSERSPLDVLNSGDWLGQIYNKLPDLNFPPNATAKEYRGRAKVWVRDGA